MITRLLIAVCLFVLPLGAWCAPAASEAALSEEIQKLVQPNPLGAGTLAVYVVDTRTSSVVANFDGETPLRPASCNKLITTAAAISLLGRDIWFTTEFRTSGTVDGGTLNGDLWVIGGGDPTISGRFQTDKRDVSATLRKWAQALAAKGITRVSGDLVADDRVFDRNYFHRDWYPGERGEWYEAEIWGLSFNDNCVDLLFDASQTQAGSPVPMRLNPPTSYATVANQVIASAQGRTSAREYIRADKSNDITATGTLTAGTTRDDSASIHNGSLFFLTVLREEMTSAGITLDGAVRMVSENEANPSGVATLVASHNSPPLTEIVNVINRNSQNYYAECALKMLGRRFLNEGSFDAGTSVVKKFIADNDIYMTGFKMTDGSGLAGTNEASCRQLVEVIALMDGGGHRRAWRESLPIGGERGTLRTRFQQNAESRRAATRIYGKTGLIGGVRSIAGIARNAQGREFYYAINANRFSVSSTRVIEMLDKIALTVAQSNY